MVWLSLNVDEIPAKILAELCAAGGWPRLDSFQVVETRTLAEGTEYVFEFEETLSPCCSCIAQEESFLRRGLFFKP